MEDRGGPVSLVFDDIEYRHMNGSWWATEDFAAAFLEQRGSRDITARKSFTLAFSR
jgi:hypothetical protein